MKRKGGIVMIALLLTALLSVCVWAYDTAEPKVVAEPKFTIEVSHVNPEYAALGIRFDQPAADCMTTAESTVSSLEDAAVYLREQMENRITEVTISVNNYNYSDDETLVGDWKWILYEAFEHTGISTQGDYIMRHYGKSEGNIGRNGYFQYTITYDTTLEQENKVGERIEELFEQWNDADGFYSMNDYEKICTIYDYICENVTYDYDNLNDKEYTLKYSAYAALINGTAVCQGYANLFYRMALEAEIDNRIVVGFGNGGYHGWNIVELSEQYYYVDATWDASRAENDLPYKWFLLGSENFCADHTPDASHDYDCDVADYPIGEEDYDPSSDPELVIVASGTCGETLTWELTADGTLTISGEGAMGSWRSGDGSPWYEYRESIKTVKIGGGVTSIEIAAFNSCSNLTSVEIPGSVTSIGTAAFQLCSSLESIEIPEGVTKIDTSAFALCSSLTSVRIPEGVTSIGYYAFQGCSSLASIEIPDSVTSVGTRAFYNCRALASVEIPDGVPGIGEMTFFNCSALASVRIPESVTSIGVQAFAGCTNLAAVYYTGTEEQWNTITIGETNDTLLNAEIIFNWGAEEKPLNGLNEDADGIWRYYVDGVVTDYTGLIQHTDGKTYYVYRGVVPMDYTGLVTHTDGKIYYVYYGIAQMDYVGLYAHTTGVIYYIDSGAISTDYTGLYTHSDGNTYYVYKGVIPTDYIGLCYHTDGKTYYIFKGVAVSNYTGLYDHTDGKVFYVNEGVIDPNFVGLYTHTTGATYYVYNGVVLTSYVGLYLHTDGNVYYVYNGILVPNYVGFYLHSDGKLYYMSEGVIAVNFTGLALHTNGFLYYVKNGVFDNTYNGTATTADGTEYEVVNGIAHP